MVGGGDLQFRVLGPIEVSGGGQSLPLGGPKQRALLADLILNAGSIVSTARLIGDLWGDDPPPTASHTVETYVSRLRRVLRDGSAPGVLLTRPPGYILNVEPGHVDAFRFEQLVRDGTAAAGRGDDAGASALLRAALALWRGQALADVADTPFARSAATRLNDQHLLAVERRIESDLKLGRAQDLVPELEALVASHGYHEPFHRQLMLALYRSGRQSEALGAFRRARGLLAGELGIEPGPELRRMEQAILRQDPELEQPPALLPQRPGPSGTCSGPYSARPGSAAAANAWYRRRALIAAGLALAVTVAAGVPLALRAAETRQECPGERHRGAVGIGNLGHLRAGNAVGAGQPGRGRGSVWATSPDGNAVYRIDPATQAITQAIGVGAGPDGIAWADGDVWVANSSDGTVSRIDSVTGQVVQTIGAGSEPTGVAAGLGAVWVTDPVGSTVSRIDPSSGQLTQTIALTSPPYAIALGAGSIWVTSPADDSVTRIDPVAGQPIQTISVGADPSAIAYGFGSVWVANGLDSTVSRINPGTGTVTQTIPVGNGPTALAVGERRRVGGGCGGRHGSTDRSRHWRRGFQPLPR